MTVGEFIKEERIRQGMSYRKVQEISGIWPRTTINLERNEGFDKLQDVLAVLGYEVWVKKIDGGEVDELP